jgi:hypothetical protein
MRERTSSNKQSRIKKKNIFKITVMAKTFYYTIQEVFTGNLVRFIYLKYWEYFNRRRIRYNLLALKISIITRDDSLNNAVMKFNILHMLIETSFIASIV